MSSSPSAELKSLTVLSGGVGGARFVQGLLHGLRNGLLPGVAPEATVTVVVNTGDDLWLHGLKICPDLDTVMYTLGDAIDPERGWGRREESWQVNTELAAYGVDQTWFGLGDRDVATHLVRTQMMEAGFPLSAVTRALCERWLTPTYGDQLVVLPMSDDRTETHVVIADDDLERSPSGKRVVHFQEYWIKLRAAVAPESVITVGLDAATPAPGVIDAITEADLVIVPPSNPIVSVGTIVGLPGVREALRTTAAPVVGISPIIDGHHLRGMAEQLLSGAGIEVSAGGVGRHYGSRSSSGVLDGWLVDTADADALPDLEATGLRAAAVPLVMRDLEATAAMAAAAVALVTDVR